MSKQGNDDMYVDQVETVSVPSRRKRRAAGFRLDAAGKRALVAAFVLVVLAIAFLSHKGRQSAPEVVRSEVDAPKRVVAAQSSVVRPRTKKPNTQSLVSIEPAMPSSPVQDVEPAASADTDTLNGTAAISRFADVVAVDVTDDHPGYAFNITIVSPDSGCDQYADWWEVVDTDGKLLYRRLLSQSHVGEQPFTRSSGVVPVDMATTVWVRAHMHPTGYGGLAMKGSVSSGFKHEPLPAEFASALDKVAPQPSSCSY